MKAWLAIGLFALGCSEGTRVNVTKTVGANGGTVNASTGTAVQIPPGALAAQAMITIQSVDVPAPAGTVIVGQAYDFGPEGATFTTPVTVMLPIDAAKIPSGRTTADVRIYTAPRGSTEYTMLPTSVSGNLATTQTTHFTVFVPAVLAPNVVADMSVGTGDMAMSGGDMAGSTGDMAKSGDMAQGSCTPVYTVDVEGCYVDATCGGIAYKLSCFPPTGANSCVCTANGSTTGSTQLTAGCNSSAAISAFMMTCVPT